MSCRTGCPTPGAHGSWGECARAADLRIGSRENRYYRRWDAGLQAYRDARKVGLQPQKPTLGSVDKAKREVGA